MSAPKSYWIVTPQGLREVSRRDYSKRAEREWIQGITLKRKLTPRPLPTRP